MSGVGAMNVPVTIKQPTVTRDASGAEIEGAPYTTVTSWWAEVLAAGGGRPIGREYYSALSEVGEVTHMLRGHYLAGVTRKMVVDLNGRTLKIRAALNLQERGAELLLLCQEEV